MVIVLYNFRRSVLRRALARVDRILPHSVVRVPTFFGQHNTTPSVQDTSPSPFLRISCAQLVDRQDERIQTTIAEDLRATENKTCQQGMKQYV